MKTIPLKEIIKDCKNSTKQIDVKEVSEIFQMSVASLYTEGTVLKRIEEKVGEEEFNIFMTTLMSTFLSTVYANTQFKTKEEAIKYATKINATKVGLRKCK